MDPTIEIPGGPVIPGDNVTINNPVTGTTGPAESNLKNPYTVIIVGLVVIAVVWWVTSQQKKA